MCIGISVMGENGIWGLVLVALRSGMVVMSLCKSS